MSTPGEERKAFLVMEIRIVLREQCIASFSFAEFWILWERYKNQINWHKNINFIKPGLMIRLRYAATMDFLTLLHGIRLTLLAKSTTKLASSYGNCPYTTYSMKGRPGLCFSQKWGGKGDELWLFISLSQTHLSDNSLCFTLRKLEAGVIEAKGFLLVNLPPHERRRRDKGLYVTCHWISFNSWRLWMSDVHCPV